MKKFTPNEVDEVAERMLEQLVQDGLPVIQKETLQLGFLNLFAELSLISARTPDEPTTV